MNASVLEGEKVIKKEKLIYCKRCLQCLGQRTEAGHQNNNNDNNTAEGGIKIWNENLLIDEGGGVGGGRVLKDQTVLGNFQNLIRKIVHDFEFVDQFTTLLPMMHKLLVKSYKTESSKEVPSVYLLVQVMDMSLDVFQWDGKDLKKQQAMKLLYCFVDATDKNQMLKYWVNDHNVHPLAVSPKMFEGVLECLRKNSELIPDVYRHSYGFDLSYIFHE